MTTSRSPRSTLSRFARLKAQAEGIAAAVKAAERGEKIDIRFAEKIEAARSKESLKIGIAMDDKVIILEMPWTTIREASEAGLAEYILKQMLGKRETLN